MDQSIRNLEGIEFSRCDRERNIILPELTEDLAYFAGILAGDGHIRLQKSDYLVDCSGNPNDEKEFYHEIIIPLTKKLFNLNLCPKYYPSAGTFGFRFQSKAIVLFLVNIVGLPKNKKYNQLKIPDWIKNNEVFLKAYIKGLADTDFSLTLKRRYKKYQYYPVITGVSASEKYINEIAEEIEKLGIKVSRSFNIARKDPRFKSGIDITHRIHIYGHSELIKWMNLIGFLSPKHINKFKLWKERNMQSNRVKVKEATKEAEFLLNYQKNKD